MVVVVVVADWCLLLVCGMVAKSKAVVCKDATDAVGVCESSGS